MRHTYINGTGCVSAQKTDIGFLENAEVNHDANILPLQTPTYKDFISPVAIRRMAKGVKNGIVASATAMKEANVETVDAIITGTGMGCIEDSEVFLRGILDNNEQFLTPTSFIQSTHNTVGAQIALGLKCKAYNFTYVNGAVSFESALLDAKMLIDQDEAKQILVGGIDETADYTMSLYKLAGIIKSDENAPYDILSSTTNGAVYGEGATFFILGSEKGDNTYAEIIDVEIINKLQTSEVERRALEFLKSNSVDVSDIDAVIFGYNGEADYDNYYRGLADGIFNQTPQAYYKHLSGEYNTASAFGLWVGSNIIKQGSIPQILKVNSAEKPQYKKILLYNQYRGSDHSFTLISEC